MHKGDNYGNLQSNSNQTHQGANSLLRAPTNSRQVRQQTHLSAQDRQSAEQSQTPGEILMNLQVGQTYVCINPDLPDYKVRYTITDVRPSSLSDTLFYYSAETDRGESTSFTNHAQLAERLRKIEPQPFTPIKQWEDLF